MQMPILCYTSIYSACGIKASNGEYLLIIPNEAKVRDAKVQRRGKRGPGRPRNIRGNALRRDSTSYATTINSGA